MSQAKKHVHLAGGKGCDLEEALLETRAFLAEVFKGRLDTDEAESLAQVVPGPLITSTQHDLMGLSPQSTMAEMKELLTAACEEVGHLDPHLSVQTKAKAKWSNHSLRRMADTTARRTKNVTEHGREVVTSEEIDLYFGWHEAELSKDMQIQ